jgi:hypothetical protein
MKILMTKLVDTVQLKGVLYLLMTYTQCSQGNHKISDSDNTDDIVTHDDKQFGKAGVPKISVTEYQITCHIENILLSFCEAVSY